MTGSAHMDLDQIIKLWNAGKRDEATSLVLSGDMRARLQAEIKRIETPGARNLLQDAVSKRTHQTLVAILEATAGY